jgi:hypothetical protein
LVARPMLVKPHPQKKEKKQGWLAGIDLRVLCAVCPCSRSEQYALARSALDSAAAASLTHPLNSKPIGHLSRPALIRPSKARSMGGSFYLLSRSDEVPIRMDEATSGEIMGHARLLNSRPHVIFREM